MNKVQVIGRLARDVERKEKYGIFTIAVNRNYKNEDGIYETDFIRFKVFSNLLDLLCDYTKKGDLLYIEASIQTGSYENDKGEKVYTTDNIVNRVEFLCSNKKQEIEKEEEKDDDLDLPF